jgi:predicted phosphodiesterase
MRIGVVGDLHAPFIHPMYRRFCMDTFAKWRVSHVHFIGDIVDLHALSFWDHNPNGQSAEDEHNEAAADVKLWHRTFGDSTVSIGNHDARHYRLARKHGLPDRYLRGYADVWRTPSWQWRMNHKFDGVLYEHGTGTSGKDAALNRAMQKRLSVVIGHVHCYAGVKWHANEFDAIFGLNVGCGIDCRAYAFEYGQPNAIRPILGCGIVVDGEHAYFEPMHCGRGQRYHRSRAGRRK